jgi:hypothetical protein
MRRCSENARLSERKHTQATKIAGRNILVSQTRTHTQNEKPFPLLLAFCCPQLFASNFALQRREMLEPLCSLSLCRGDLVVANHFMPHHPIVATKNERGNNRLTNIARVHSTGACETLHAKARHLSPRKPPAMCVAYRWEALSKDKKLLSALVSLQTAMGSITGVKQNTFQPCTPKICSAPCA